ncbi:hypothetical protein BRAS3843_370012 [Bradyrhizobium sp. STM 3843]|nr:hypothetical protein BRAS3843_370012 [Bradyrhizobium sp. STM 3843]
MRPLGPSFGREGRLGARNDPGDRACAGRSGPGLRRKPEPGFCFGPEQAQPEGLPISGQKVLGPFGK